MATLPVGRILEFIFANNRGSDVAIDALRVWVRVPVFLIPERVEFVLALSTCTKLVKETFTKYLSSMVNQLITIGSC